MGTQPTLLKNVESIRESLVPGIALLRDVVKIWENSLTMDFTVSYSLIKFYLRMGTPRKKFGMEYPFSITLSILRVYCHARCDSKIYSNWFRF